MHKKYCLLLPIIAFAVSGCSNTETKIIDPVRETLINGGFESSNLSGWTIEYGNAFDDGSVSSNKTFTYSYDPEHVEIKIGQEGNWYLSGKGFDGTYSNGRIGAIRSNNFKLGGDGSIAVKLAGGASTRGKGTGAARKSDAEICYFGVYRASDDRMIAKQINEYFIEHTEEYVDVKKYNAGVYSTDNFVDYEIDLADYIGEELYVRIVDNDKDVYYGYLSVDDIRIGGEDPQEEGEYYVKTRQYVEEATAPSEYEIANGDFELGSLAGWEVIEGLAFSNEGVNHESTWWNENISYQREGEYHYGYYKPSATGKMRSTRFKLGGSGYISFKLGGCRENYLTYLSIYKVIDDTTSIEVARYSHRTYWDFQFPYVANGMRLLNLIQYIADLREYIGDTLYIEVVDNNTSPDDLACMTLDSIYTYYPEKPTFYNQDHFEAHSMINIETEIESEYQVKNGTFEKGNLENWTLVGDAFATVTDKDGWWDEGFTFNKNGRYLLSGETSENLTGYIQSESFKVGGIGKMSFRFGGGKDPRFCYISLYDKETNQELARYANRYFHDLGTSLLNKGSNLMNMVQYVADISEFMDKEVYIRVNDFATNNWGLVTVDSFITYYVNENSLPLSYYDAVDILPTAETTNEYQVLNGGFEKGDFTGWTFSTGGEEIGNIGYDEVWWNEWYDFNKTGTYFFSGWNGKEEATGSLTSSEFTIGGTGYISFKLGGGKNKENTYVEIIDSTTEESLIKFSNYKFNDQMARRYFYNGQPIDLSNDDIYMANMVQYVADLSSFMGRKVKIRLVDNASSDWGLLFADDFVTYYESSDSIVSGLEAKYE